MTKKYFIYAIISILFSSLIACGGSDSSASGDNKKENSETVNACALGTNNLKEGESCKIDSGNYADTYTCKSGKVVYSTGETVKGGSWTSTDPTKLIVINCR
jgi:hypothetical protein